MAFIKSSEEPIPYETGFPENDHFGLKRRGERLSTALDSVDDTLVIAIDGPWGSGKSYFLKCWSKDHGMKADVIYFDAFKHDYLDDPLVSLVMAISERVDEGTAEKLRRGAKRLLPLLARISIAAATFGAVKGLDDLGDVIATEVGDKAKSVADGLWKLETGRYEAMDAFRSMLKKAVESAENKRLVVIVDELDRCRPDYALRVVETIKHFFSVDGVHFVLGTNLKQFSSAVRSRYGSAFDAEKYLQRFIHATFSVHPNTGRREPSNDKVAQYFALLDREENFYFVKTIVESVPAENDLSFRDMERLYTLCRVVPDTGRTQLYDVVFYSLLVVKACRPVLIDKILDDTLDPKEFVRFFDLEAEAQREADGRGRIWHFFATFLLVAIGEKPIETLPDYLRSVFETSQYDKPNSFLKSVILRYLSDFNVR